MAANTQDWVYSLSNMEGKMGTVSPLSRDDGVVDDDGWWGFNKATRKPRGEDQQ